MNNELSKISPTLQASLADASTKEKQEAIVIFRPEEPVERPRGRIRALKRRLDAIKLQASAQMQRQTEFLDSYRKEGVRRMTKSLRAEEKRLNTSVIGGSQLPVASVEVTKQTLPALAEQDDVVAIIPNQKIHLIQPKEIEYDALGRQELGDGVTWGLSQLEIPELWSRNANGRQINVAVLDTGVYGNHPALADRVKQFMVVDPLGRRIRATPSFDGGSHGTHVCGTIAGGTTPDGVAIGVAPEANLLAGGVLVGDASLSTLLEGISWAVENGADVINMSLGFSYYEPHFTKVFETLIDYYGVLPVVAIGNENHGNTSSPGSAYNAFSVGAAEKLPRNRTAVAPFSSGASLEFPGDPSHALVTKPDVVAPGAQVYSCIPPERHGGEVYDYTYMDGTSMATPHVSGVVALLMSAHPDAPVQDIVEALKETAHHPGGEASRPDNRWGFGMVRPLEALRALA